MKIPNPAIVTQTAAQRLPLWALISICLVYVLTGLVNRDPWKSLDISSFGYMWEISQGYSSVWHPEMAGSTPELSGPLAYAIGAGAISVSELCIVGKPLILVPSPNVAEDHQTKNANALVAKNAAVLITDSEAPDLLFKIALDLLKKKEKCALLSLEIKKIQKLNATADIVDAFENSLIENGTK